ncbi:MAG: sodium:proton antiporter [FCB group bacterium]|nr:sodium:proton antiporter [FCB group bacterium]
MISRAFSWKTMMAVLVLVPAGLLANSGGAEIQHAAPHLDGSSLSIFWAIPFAGILLSIAVFPLVASEFWHHHYGKVSAFWALVLLIPFFFIEGASVTVFEVLHVSLLEYIPFIILLLALFTISGGIRLRGQLVGSPGINLVFLIIGTVLASWMGTTGAAMLLIRPLLKANAWRKRKVHVVAFFIFLVANIGGSLTPLGDPPLFLGFLKGVHFFWTTTALLKPMLLAVGILLTIFYVMDTLAYRKEDPANMPEKDSSQKIGVEGGINFLLLAGVVLAVLMSGFWSPDVKFNIYHVEMELQNFTRDLLLLLLTVISMKITSQKVRQANDFNWFPIVEVAKLFAGIFVTIIPAIAILKAGTHGALANIINLVSHNGEPVNTMYFWLTGSLSSFLDNAPTYLVFFNSAGGDPIQLMEVFPQTLIAISCGAVFMGANTYIGNAPNFMVKSISEQSGVEMPSFFGYIFKYSLPILIPTFIVISLVFF